MYPTISASGAFSSVPVANDATGSDGGPPPEFQTLSADMTVACSSTRWEYVGQPESPSRTAPPLEPQAAVGQREEASTDSSSWREIAFWARSLARIQGQAIQQGDNLREVVENWRIFNKMSPKTLEIFWNDGDLTPLARVLHTRENMGDAAWRKRGEELLELSEAIDIAKKSKSKGKALSFRAWSRKYRISRASLHHYAKRGELTSFARTWVEQVRELMRNEESAKLGRSQDPVHEALQAPAAGPSSAGHGHLTTASLPQFSEVFCRGSNRAWAVLPRVRFAPAQPLLSPDVMMYGDS